MAENEGSKEDKFDQFTQSGERIGYISLEQARVLAMQHARDNTDFYGPAYSGLNLVWEVISQEEGEDYYDVKLSFRPAGRYRGEPGVEQFIIDKTGSIEIHQILDEPTGVRRPSRIRSRPRWLIAVGLVVVAVVAVATVLVSGVLDRNGQSPGLAPPVATQNPTPAVTGPASTLPPPTAVSTSVAANTITLAQLKQRLLRRLQEAAPGADPALVKEVIAAVLADAESSGKTSFSANDLQGIVRSIVQKVASSPPDTTNTISLAQLKQRLLERLQEAAPGADPALVDQVIAVVLTDAQASGKTSFSADELQAMVRLAVQKLRPRPVVTAPGGTINPQPLLTVALPGPDHRSKLPRDRSLDSLAQLRPMFEYLVGVDWFTGEVVPMLAETWEGSENDQVWTFNLRRGVQFHFGWGEFTARDVVHSMSQLRQGPSRAETSEFWQGALRNLRVNDAHSITFVLNRPVPDLPRYVSVQFDLMILSKAQWDADGEARMQEQPAGTGPYQFLESNPGDSIRFQRMEKHWRHTPQFSELLVRIASDPALRFALLKAGEVDMAVVPLELAQQLSSDGLKFSIGQQAGTMVGLRPEAIAAYTFPGNIPGVATHLEYVEAVR